MNHLISSPAGECPSLRVRRLGVLLAGVLVLLAGAGCHPYPDTRDVGSWPRNPGDIFEAARTGNLEKMQLLLEANSNLASRRDSRGATPLFYAAGQGNKDVVALLLAYNAPVDARANDGKTPLHAAAARGNREVAGLLLDNHAEVDPRDTAGATPLLDAAAAGQRDTMGLLVDRGAQVDARNTSGETALHLSASKGYRDVVELLLTKQADPRAPDRNGATPLHYAAGAGYRDVVELLLPRSGVDVRDSAGRTPLWWAVESGHRDVAELLLANRAEANLTDDSGRTLLHMASGTGQKDMVELLIAFRADPRARNRDGQTPLHNAAESGHGDVVAVLLASGAAVNARDQSGLTPLHVAAAHGRRDVAELLLLNRADVNTTTTEGLTPLHLAAGGGGDSSAGPGFRQVAELLLANQAAVNARDNHGLTPLHWAANAGRGDVVDVLLAHDADVYALDDRGETPLQLAISSRHDEVVELLLPRVARQLDAADLEDQRRADRALAQAGVVVAGPQVVDYIRSLGNDYIFFTSREHPLRSLDEITDLETQVAALDFSPRMRRLGDRLNAAGTMRVIGDDRFAELFRRNPELRLVVVPRDNNRISMIEGVGGGVPVQFLALEDSVRWRHYGRPRPVVIRNPPPPPAVRSPEPDPVSGRDGRGSERGVTAPVNQNPPVDARGNSPDERNRGSRSDVPATRTPPVVVRGPTANPPTRGGGNEVAKVDTNSLAPSSTNIVSTPTSPVPGPRETNDTSGRRGGSPSRGGVTSTNEPGRRGSGGPAGGQINAPVSSPPQAPARGESGTQDTEWNATVQTGTPAAYLKYYRAHPDSAHLKVSTGTVKTTPGTASRGTPGSVAPILITIDGADAGISMGLQDASAIGIVNTRPVMQSLNIPLGAGKTTPNTKIIRNAETGKVLTFDVGDAK